MPANLETALQEIEDIRHLFAHNFAGQADETYFSSRARHVLKGAEPHSFSCGASFDGKGVPMDFGHVCFYANKTEAILALLP
jgi:hypothetical protein